MSPGEVVRRLQGLLRFEGARRAASKNGGPIAGEAPPRAGAESPEPRAEAAELERLRQDLDRMSRIQAEVATLLKCESPEKIPHALRNLLNREALLKEILKNQRNG